MARAADTEAFFGFPALATMGALFASADIVVLANNHPAFQNLDLVAAADRMNKPGLIYDFWNMHDDTEGGLPGGRRYVALGAESI